MEAITRLVADSLARHGFDRPVDARRLQWSRWSRCDTPHSLLVVPSKPGIFALAEEIMDLGNAHVATDAFVRPAEPRSAAASTVPTPLSSTVREGHDFSRAVMPPENSTALAAGVPQRRMLAVLQFSEDDDMAFTLDRMFTCVNPMRARLASGRCFLRFVVIEDQLQRRNICTALNQWMLNSAEKATGLPPDFSSSLELPTDHVSKDQLSTDHVGAGDPPAQADSPTNPVGRTLLSDSADTLRTPAQGSQPNPQTNFAPAPPYLDSGAAKNLHCPHPLPSGF